MAEDVVGDARRELLRHALATLAYRGGKAVRGAPDAFAAFHLAATSRTPVQILAHIGDLLDWAQSLIQGVRLAGDAIDTGRARQKLSDLARVTNYKTS